jgi:Short C-terminal domain
VAVGDGHLVSAAWVIPPRKNAGPYFLVRNHTTRQSFFNKMSTQKVMTFPYPKLYIAMLTLMLLPLPFVILFAFTSWWQIGGFKRSGVKPLLAVLESDAAKLTGPPPTERAQPERVVDGRDGATLEATPSADAQGVASTSSELQRLADLHQQGLLTGDEFAKAKAKLLS